MKRNYIKTLEISWQDEVIHEVLEWKREPKKLRVPDMASRGRGMPKPGPPRPVFSAPAPGGPAAAGRGRGRGATPASSRPQRPQREASAAPKKTAKPMAASPFGAPAGEPPGKTEDVIAPKEKPAEQPTPSPTPAPEIKNTPEPEKAQEAKENRPLQMAAKEEPAPTAPSKPAAPAKPAAPKAPKDPNANAGQEGGLYGMMNGLLGFLNLRKQAYTGKPASAIYYDEKKGRYVIAGEEESDDDEPAPPPPGARRGAAQPAGEEQKAAENAAGGKEDAGEVAGASGLAGVAFGGGALSRGRGAQRGRGATRGRGRGGLAGRGGAGRFPEALDPSAVKASDKPESVAQAETPGSQAALNQTALYQTAIGGSQLDISGLPNDASRVENDGTQNESQSQMLNSTIMDSTQQSFMAPGSNTAEPGTADSQAKPGDHSARTQSQACDPAREAVWQAAFTKQQGKILAYKRRVQKQQGELLRQREENEQTIETFTQLCQDLKFRGMDEVDDLQGQLRLLQDQVSSLSRDKAELEVQARKQKFDIEDLQMENKEYQERIRKQKQTITENLLQLESSSRNAEQELSSLVADNQNQGPGINGGIQANQGLGGTPSTQQTWSSSLSRAQPSTSQGEQAQSEILKLLDAQYENEKLEWQLSIHRVDQAHLISEVHKLLKENEELAGLKQKMKSIDIEMEKQKGLIKTLKDEALAKVQLQLQEDQKHDQQEKQQLRAIITKLQQEKERTQELQRERQKGHDMKLQSLQQENQQLEQAIKKLAIEKQSQHNQIERSQVVHQDAESALADVRLQLQAKEEQMEKARTGEREAQERLNNQKRTEKERMDKNKNEWCDQVKQLEGILSNKEQQYERLRQQKQEVEEQMEQILTTQSEQQQHTEVPNKKSQQALINQLEQQDQMKQKLNEHIMYLQNEIRKRDELLETSDLDVGSDLSNNSDDEEFEVKLSHTVNQQDLVDGDDHDPDDDVFEKFQQRLQSTPSLKSREEAQRAQAQAENINEAAPSETNTKRVEDQIHHQLNKVDQKKKKKKTMQQLLKDQIEDSRRQLQQEIENRMRKEKDIRLKEETLRKLKEGYCDVLKVIKDIVSVNIEHQQSSQAQLQNQTAAEDEDDSKSSNKSVNSENLLEQELDEEELVHNAISGVFEIQKYYQAQLSDLTHTLQMEKLKLEDMESLTLDLEILEQEKSMAEEEIQQLKSQVTSAQSLLHQKQDQVLEQQSEDELKILQLQAAVDELNLKLVKQTDEHKKQSTQASQGWQERLQQETARFEREVLPELEQRHEERLKQCRVEMMQYKDAKDKMTEEHRATQSQHAQVQQDLSSKDAALATLRGQLQQAEFQLKQASDQNQIVEIEKQELKNAYDNLKQVKEEEAERLQSSLSDRDQEIAAQKRYAEESASQMSQMRKDFDSRSQELVQRRDEHKQQAKDLHVDISGAKEDLEQCELQKAELLSQVETQAQEIMSLKSTNSRREDEMFWPLVQQVSQLKSELTAKEQQRKATAEELEVERKSQTVGGGDLQQMRAMYNEQIDQIESEKEAEAKRVVELQAVIAELELKRPAKEPTTDQAKDDQLAELQSLADYQMSINDQLNVRLDELEQQNEELQQDHQKQIKMTEAAAQRSELASSFFAHAEQQRANELTQLREQLEQQQVLTTELQAALDQAKQSAPAASAKAEQPGSGEPITSDSNPSQDHQEDIQQLTKQRDFVSRLLEEKTAAHRQSEEQIATHESEIQQLKKLISTTNANQGEFEAQAERAKQELAEAKASLQSEIDHLKEETMQAQYQVELTKAESGFEQDQDLHERDKELEEGVLVKQAELEQMTKERDREAKRAKELEEREPLFKKAAEDLAKQFKEKLKKLKDENKKYKEDLAEVRGDGSTPSLSRSGAGDDLAKVEAERDQLKLELEHLRGEQLSIIEHLEASKDFSVVLDRNSSLGGRDESVLSNIKKLELNLSNLDNKVDSMTQEKQAVIQKILECLKNSGMAGIDASEEFKSFEHVLEKLQELLQNYDEDRRQLQSLLEDNERVQKENEDYKNLNHDLRYDLQELNIAYEKLEAEKQSSTAAVNQPAFTHAPAQEAQAQQVLEESREMKTEYIQQAYRQEQETSALKGQLAAETSFAAPVVRADQPVSQRATDDKYADLSINASLSRGDANESKSKETKGQKANVSGAPARQPATQAQSRAATVKPVEKRQAPVQQPAAAGGLFGTIASFFLTESEMEGRQGGRAAATGRSGTQADEASEYEYYEEYDEEGDSDGDAATTANKAKSTAGSSQSSARGNSADPGRPPAQDAYQMMHGGLSNL